MSSTGQRFALPFETVVDPNSGIPLLGAQLQFYLTGSSTPAPTYADQGLTVANANPVPAATGGRFSNIFLDPAVTYKVVLLDQNGVQQWSADPVTVGAGATSGFTAYANIAALRQANTAAPTPMVYVEAYSTKVPTGGGWFAYVASDTSSADNGGTVIVDQSGNRYYRLWFGACSIDNFGAVQDNGVTDNAAAINAALSACQDVLVPGSSAGAWYGFGSQLVIKSKGRLAGVGKGSILKANASFGTGGPLLQNATPAPTNAAARDDGIVIENLTLDGNSQGNASIALVAVTNFRVRGVYALNGGLDAVLIAAKSTDATVYPQNGRIEDLYAYSFQGAAVAITAGVEIWAEDVEADTCGLVNTAPAAIKVQAAATSSLGRNVHIIDPIVRNCGAATTSCGILIDGAGSATWSEMEVVGGSVDAQTGNGLGYRDVGGLEVTGLAIVTPSAAGVTHMSGAAVGSTGLLFNGVAVKGATADGFYLYNETDAVLNGCIARGCGRDGVRLDGASGATTTYTGIIGGVFTGNTGYGVNEASSSYVDYTKLWGSHRNGNTAGAQSLSGANSICDATFVSATFAPTANTGSVTLAHGLGMKPKTVRLFIRCTTAELGHAVGDTLELRPDSTYGGGNGLNWGGAAWVIDAVNCGYGFAQNGAATISGSSNFGVTTITVANWTAFVVATGYYA